jgi:hypothetical protein
MTIETNKEERELLRDFYIELLQSYTVDASGNIDPKSKLGQLHNTAHGYQKALESGDKAEEDKAHDALIAMLLKLKPALQSVFTSNHLGDLAKALAATVSYDEAESAAPYAVTAQMLLY